MSGFFQKLLHRRPDNNPAVPTENPVAAAGFTGKADSIKAAAGAYEGEAAQAEYAEFCAAFFHKPGVKFSDFVDQNQIARLKKWMQPETLEPEPKAFIRLILEMNRQQINFWEEVGVSIYLKKRTEYGGGPSPESMACVSLLAQALDKPITYYFPDPDSDEVKALDFTEKRSERESGHANSGH